MLVSLIRQSYKNVFSTQYVVDRICHGGALKSTKLQNLMPSTMVMATALSSSVHAKMKDPAPQDDSSLPSGTTVDAESRTSEVNERESRNVTMASVDESMPPTMAVATALSSPVHAKTKDLAPQDGSVLQSGTTVDVESRTSEVNGRESRNETMASARGCV